MPLIDLKTDFKSLKFGKDRPNGGSSNQPYIQTPIPDDDKAGIPSTKDFLLRGGLSAPINAAKDVSRLTQMFFDLKDPSGVLFTAKENLLSRTSAKTESSTTAGSIYTPLSTLGQSAIGFAGGHLNLLGLDPTGLSGLSIQKYENVVKENNRVENNSYPETIETTEKKPNPFYLPPILGAQPPSQEPEFIEVTSSKSTGGFKNRLASIWYNKQLGKDNSPNILEYGGGPGSILGIGKTRIKFADQRTGTHNPLSTSNPSFFYGTGHKDKFALSTQSKDISSKLKGVTNFSSKLLPNVDDRESIQNSENPNRITNKYFALDRDSYKSSKYTHNKNSILFDSVFKGNGLSSKYNNQVKNIEDASLLNIEGYTSGEGFSVYKNVEGDVFGNTPLQKANNSNTSTQKELIQQPENSGKKSGSPSIFFDSISKKGGLSSMYNTRIQGIDGAEVLNSVESFKFYDPNIYIQGPDSTLDNTPFHLYPHILTQGQILSQPQNHGKFFGNPGVNEKLYTSGSLSLKYGKSSNQSLPKLENLPNYSVYKNDINNPNSLFLPNTTLQYSNNSKTLSLPQINWQDDNPGKKEGKPKIQDFRKELLGSSTYSRIMSSVPSYRTSEGKNLEERVNLGDPGKSQNVFSYTSGGKLVDAINASSIYEAEIANHKNKKNDLVKFSIGVLQNNKTKNADFMHFRSFIDSFNDSYTADWGDVKYVGRGDKFYNYEGFDRTINMSFTVYAQSKKELIPMYEKLNFLASSLAPSYGEGGFMQGNLVYLTLGGYLFKQLGIIKSLTYDTPQESTWEIGIADAGGYDSNVKELPHMIKVTGLSFTPIHDFVPRKSTPYNQRDTRFIALANNTDKNKSSYSKITKNLYEYETNQKDIAKKKEEDRNKEETEFFNDLEGLQPIPTKPTNLSDVDLSGGGTQFPTQ